MPPIAAPPWQCGMAVAPCHPAEANQHGAVFAAGLESYPLTHCTSFVASRCSDTMRLAAATLGTNYQCWQ
jgi:hypothetical protein